MIEIFTNLLNFFRKSSPIFLIGIAIACSLLLFLSEYISSLIGVYDFRSEYRGYIGGLLVFSLSILLAKFFWWAIKSIKINKSNKLAWKIRYEHLHELTPDEKAYLKPYIKEDVNTQYFLIEDGIANGCKRKFKMIQNRQFKLLQ